MQLYIILWPLSLLSSLTHTHTHTHTHTALTLSNWLLDLDEGSLTLSASGVPGTDHSGLNCRAFTLVNEM